MDKNCNNGISRRSALKRMGLLIAGAACINMPTLTSCNMDTKKRIILYFTGTGNCLYVARELADEHTELLSIPQLVKQNRYTLEADEIGIVYPVYGHMPPNMVREFIKKAHLKAGYKFAILTYGNRKCSSVEIWDDISQKAGCPFDYITTMIMVDNWLPNFDISYNGNTGVYSPDFIPEQWVLDLFQEYPGDIRYSANFMDVNIFETYPATIFSKFLGNPTLKDPNTVGYSGRNLVKPFRISEQYLILAEAYARSGNSPEAFNVLNELKSKRIPGYTADNSGDVLERIFDERIKELMGEGFYWTDLKRFGKGIERGAAQPGTPIRPINEDMHRDASDWRFVWPIPQEELDSNPNMANQQNPGY